MIADLLRSYKFKFLIITAIYYISGKLGLLLSFFEQSVTLVWPPTGIALAALLLLGLKYWPAIALGAFLINYTSNLSFMVSFIIMIGNTSTAFVAACILNKMFKFSSNIDRVIDVFSFIAVAVLMAPLISSMVGGTVLVLSGTAEPTMFGKIWFGWWLGDAIGVLIFGSVILVWYSMLPVVYDKKSIADAALLFLSIIIISHVVFGFERLPENIIGPISYLVFPVIIIASIRFKQVGAVTAVLVVSIIAVWQVVSHIDLMQSDVLRERLLYLHGYLLVLSCTAMLIAASVHERQKAAKILQGSINKYMSLMEEASDAIVIADIDDRILETNKQASNLFGYTQDEFLNKDLHSLHSELKVKSIHDCFSNVKKNLCDDLRDGKIITKTGSIIPVDLVGSLIEYSDTEVVQLIYRDSRAIKQLEEDRLKKEKDQRNALVREVHHRIKNNLQGVIGLLQQQARVKPSIKNNLQTAIGQVNSIAIVHGLQSHQTDEKVDLCEMTEIIARSLGDMTGVDIEFVIHASEACPIEINADEATPIALVINELINNACKHGGEFVEQQRNVKIEFTTVKQDSTVRIKIMNEGKNLQDNFNFEGGQGLGVGLKLVKSLLPPIGVELSVINEKGYVLTTLDLGYPIIHVRGSS